MSVSGQIEQAIALERLREKYGLNDIGLEAYLKTDEDLNVDWFAKTSKGYTKSAIRVAINLLKEGEISAAEFMKLVYHDIRIHKIEDKKDYDIKLPKQSSVIAIQYLLKIALPSVREADVPEILELQKKIETFPKDGNKDTLRALTDRYLKLFFSGDAWVMEKYNQFKDTSSSSLEEEIQLYEEIIDKATERGIALTSEDKAQMDSTVAFFKGRYQANTTMVDAVAAIPETRNDSLLAMIIGAAHTKGIVQELSARNLPFVVMTPKSLNDRDKKGKLDMDAYDRKMLKKSTCTDSYLQVLTNIFRKKPAPVLNEPWFQKKAEIYLLTEIITTRILGPGGPPPVAPYGFSVQELKGKWVSVDPRSITVIDDGEDKNAKAVLFEITIEHETSGDQNISEGQTTRTPTKMWMKSRLTDASENSGINNPTINNDIDMVKSLENALKDVKSKEAIPGRPAQNKGRINISINVVAAIATTEEEARQTSLAGS